MTDNAKVNPNSHRGATQINDLRGNGAMKPGTFVRLPDGREGTVVYHGLDGYGIMFGRIAVDVDAINGTQPLFGEAPKDWPYNPEAMLREPWPGAKMECVGDEYEVIE